MYPCFKFRFWSKISFFFRKFRYFPPKLPIIANVNFNICRKFRFLTKLLFSSKIHFCLSLSMLAKISILFQYFNFGPKFRFFFNISIFVQNFDFFFKISIFVQNLDFLQNFNFRPKVGFFFKISIFVQDLDFQ